LTILRPTKYAIKTPSSRASAEIDSCPAMIPAMFSKVSTLAISYYAAVAKGREKTCFRAPLSREMLRSLCRARIAGRVMHDRQSREWVFPASSRSGHVEEIKGSSWVNGTNGAKRKIVRLTKVGHSLRHSYRTLCAAAGLDRLRTKLLMNHQVSRDVTDAYLSTPALFEQLREAQRAVSDLIARSAGQDPDGRLTGLLLTGSRDRRGV
jgi:integrase